MRTTTNVTRIRTRSTSTAAAAPTPAALVTATDALQDADARVARAARVSIAIRGLFMVLSFGLRASMFIKY